MGGWWCAEAYFPLLCHQYLPKNVDRILYLDSGDVILTGDISEYYFADFEGKSIIATSANWISDGGVYVPAESRKYLNNLDSIKHIANGSFNSGSYVINVEKLRRLDYTKDNFMQIADMLNALFLPNGIREGFPYAYFGDEGLMSVCFLGDMKFWKTDTEWGAFYRPYNCALFRLDVFGYNEPPYKVSVVHYTGPEIPKPHKIYLNYEKLKEIRATDYIVGMYEKWWNACKSTPLHKILTEKQAAVSA